jgi:hypothetical protein
MFHLNMSVSLFVVPHLSFYLNAESIMKIYGATVSANSSIVPFIIFYEQ